MSLSDYRTIVPVTHDATVSAIQAELVKLSPAEYHDRVRKSLAVGSFFICEDDRYPGFVLEYVLGRNEDSVTTLYHRVAPMLDTSSVATVRKNLIDEIEACHMAHPGTMVIEDTHRGREVHLHEMGTAQLVDVLREFTTQERGVVAV